MRSDSTDDQADDRTSQPDARWDFANVDASSDPQAFVRFLQRHRKSGQTASVRQLLSYDLLRPHEGHHLLDVGCGLGDDVRALARIVGSAGRMVGVDNSERLLEVARARSEGVEHPGVFAHGDMHHLPFADATFDGCRCERVLVHSATPAAVVGEMLRVLRPGGRIVATEPDLDTLVFDATPLAVVRRLTQWHSDRVRSGTVGRHLPAILRQCGLEDVETFPTVAQSMEYTSYPGTLVTRAQQAGVITPDEAQAVLDDWRQRAAEGTYLEFGVFFTVVGRKPAT
jgi:ubiquinone/menaquinone biosynthesis C-methylase UbiE